MLNVRGRVYFRGCFKHNLLYIERKNKTNKNKLKTRGFNIFFR